VLAVDSLYFGIYSLAVEEGTLMRVTPKLLAMTLAAWLLASPALAQDAKPACAQLDASLPPELAAWSQRSDIVSAARSGDLASAVLTPGQAVNAQLHPTREVTYAAQPEKPGGSLAHGGLLRLRIATPGTYRVVLGSGAWIDVLKNGKPVASSAHAPGPACSTARKTVEFPLVRGDYVLQVSANADPMLAILVLQRP
jgi:hypothetical protein